MSLQMQEEGRTPEAGGKAARNGIMENKRVESSKKTIEKEAIKGGAKCLQEVS